ncbi:MAG: hypothetical protein K6T83_04155 [Alicyclobacillus sp.]|nr:hypothetical protein [Alicyclobacillus sp.]
MQPAVDPAVPQPPAFGLARKLTWWVLTLPAAMAVALATHNLYLLNVSHVMSGVLWTGTDIFLGFFLGPIMSRRLTPEQRRAVINWLTPKTMLYMPVLGFTTGTAGWYLAHWMGMLVPGNPMRPWVFAALAILTILALTGFGVLLPNSIRTYLELQRPTPNLDKIFRLNRFNNRLAGVQGTFQVLIILVMAHLTVG